MANKLNESNIDPHENKPIYAKNIIINEKTKAQWIDFYGNRLTTLDAKSLGYLKTGNPVRYEAYREELSTAFNLLMKDLISLKKEGVHGALEQERCAQILKCADLLAVYDASTTEIDKAVQASDKPSAYLATLIAPFLAETMLSLSSREALSKLATPGPISSAEIIDELKTFVISGPNYHRLNWAWGGGGLLPAIISEMPAGMGHATRAQNSLHDFGIATSYMSFVFYFLRFSINVYLVFAESVATDETKEEDRLFRFFDTNRLLGSLDKRKFQMINDSFWGVANFACFWLLVGSKTLVWANGLLTGGLLTMDLAMTAIDFLENQSAHKAKLALYEKTWLALDAERAQLQFEQDALMKNRSEDNNKTIEGNQLKIDILREHARVLQDAQKAAIREWDISYKNFGYDLANAALLVAGLAVVCCFFIPATAAAFSSLPVTSMVLFGSAFLFALTIAHNALNNQTKIEKTADLKIQLEEEKSALIKKEQDNYTAYEVQRLGTKIARHELVLTHQQRELARQVTTEILVPAVALTFLMFLPSGMALPILIPVVMVLLASGMMFEHMKARDLEQFDENASSPLALKN